MKVAPFRAALRRNRSPVTLHDLPADGQAYACSLIMAAAVEALKGLKDAVEILFVKPDPIILHKDLDP